MKNSSYNKIQYLVKQLSQTHYFFPFSKLVMAFCHDLSQMLMTDISLRAYPDIIALAYWLRLSNIQKLKQSFEKAAQIKLPRGIAFHITPGNVDTMFAYSWIISLLAGNKNIVRLSDKSGETQQRLITIIDNLLNSPSYKKVKQANVFINYKHDDAITAFLSLQCDVRVIWGGDKTINTIRKFPLAATSKDIVFADRFSFAFFNSKDIIKNQQLNKLCHLFYRDIFTFGQQACSSPRMLIWYGDAEENKQAKVLFWDAFKDYLQASSEPPEAASVVNKLVHCQLMALEGNQINNDLAPYLSRINISQFNAEMSKQHCGEGLLYEAEIESFSKLSTFTSKHFQTCSYFGFSHKEIKVEVLNGHFPHILRFVAIGNALDFDVNWDGMNLLDEFSKQVLVK